MKVNNLFGILLLSLCWIGVSGCSDENNGDREEQVIVTVKAETLEESCLPFLSTEKVIQEFMQVKEDGETDWRKMGLGTITGFNYKDGWEYRLQLKKTFLSNPLADGADVTYQLEKVLAKEQKNSEIVMVNRYSIGRNIAFVAGNGLTVAEEKDIEDKILAKMPQESWQVYKFIYTNQESLRGKVVIYAGNTKTEGTFQVTEDGRKFTLLVDDVTTDFFISKVLTKSDLIVPVAFIEDVTAQYKVDYPALEAAYAQHVISKIIR